MYDGNETSWRAELDLRFRKSGTRATVHARHYGPLRIQKALYPEGDATCHVVVLHPPGGIAGGDSLDLDVGIERGAHGVITTPGATRWYKANGRRASQRVALAIEGDLEWLPQEAIVFDGADVRSQIEIRLTGRARTIGWDIVAFGRQQSGERFDSGRFAQTICLTIDDELTWIERTRISGGDALFASPIGLAGHHALGCLWAAGFDFTDARCEDLVECLGDEAGAVLTRLTPRLVVARALASSTESVRAQLEPVWGALRQRLFGYAATRPRLWAT